MRPWDICTRGEKDQEDGLQTTLHNTQADQWQTDRFYGFTENRREIDMDMREMVAKVKRGEPIYGTSQLTEYMQGVASRQSRYAGVWIHNMPWFNLVNHNQVCISIT